MLKVLDLGFGKLVSSVHGREVFSKIIFKFYHIFIVLRKMLFVEQKLNRKTINLSLESFPTNNKNFTSKKFCPGKINKNPFILSFSGA
jgi:hypothetical protein